MLGSRGEHLAAKYLVNRGYRLVVSNFLVPVGRNRKGVQVTGEIDLVVLDGETVVFVEVKTRRSEDLFPILSAVDVAKRRQITRTARIYRRIFNILDRPYRFDVVTVLVEPHSNVMISHEKSFWTEAVFRKRTWNDDRWYGHA